MNSLGIVKEFVERMITGNLDSIIQFLKTYAGLDEHKAQKCRNVDEALSYCQLDVKKFRAKNFPEGLYIYTLNYEKRCYKWNVLQMWCRSTYVIVDEKKGEIEVHFAFDKFFNLDEREGWRYGDLIRMNLVEVTRKADGTLLVVLYSNILGKWIMGTQRIPHFVNPFTLEIAEFNKVIHPQILRGIEIESKLCLENLKNVLNGLEDYTLMFEMVDPFYETKIGKWNVILGSEMAKQFEKKSAVYFLTMRNMKTLELLRYSKAHEEMKQRDFTCIESIEFKTFDDVIEMARKGIFGEGVVARFESSEIPYRLVKIKTVQLLVFDKFYITKAILKGEIDDILPILTPEQREEVEKLRNAVIELTTWLEKYVEFIRKHIWTSEMKVEDLKKKLKGMKYSVTACLDYVIAYLRGKIRFETLCTQFVKTLNYDPDSIKRLITRIQNFLHEYLK